MARLLPAALMLLACTVQAQPAPDPLKSEACAVARRQLDAALAATGPRERLDAARSRAALACLGNPAPAPPDGRFVPPPVVVAPILVPSAPVTPPTAGDPRSAPPPVVGRPSVITACDATGCWDSEGRRHNAQGPVLVGPRGVCTVQGGLLNCP